MYSSPTNPLGHTAASTAATAHRATGRRPAPPRVALFVLTCALVMGVTGGIAPAHADAVSEVVKIDWASFTQPLPTDNPVGLAVLRNANKYAVNAWYYTVKNYDAQDSGCLTFGGVGEGNIRPASSEASSLAISLKMGAYSPSVTGVSNAAATAIARRLAASVACRHIVNAGVGGWGHADGWQTAYWAYQAGYAGWLLWSDLSAIERLYVAQMVEYEANRFNAYVVPYYRNNAGVIVRPTNSAAEENAWNASLLQLATAMMPGHPNRTIWMNKLLELQMSSFAQPSDTTSTRIINGKPVASWIDGSNAEEDGTVVNHGILHPDYMATVQLQAGAPVIYGLAGMGTPESALFNADQTYDTLVDLSFAAPPYDAPGGRIYARTGGGAASDVLYYPDGNDWGTLVRANYAALDGHAYKFGYDSLASIKGNTWETIHSQTLLDLQSRFSDGHTYLNDSEFDYDGREEVLAELAARQWAAHWIVAQNAFELSTAGADGLGYIDDGVRGHTYSGTWTKYVDANDIGGGHHTANSAGATMSMPFTGTRAKLISLRAYNRGIGKVYLDGVFKANVDFYTPGIQYQFTAYDTGVVAAGPHTLRVDWTGTKNPSSTNTYVDVDAVKVSLAADAGTSDESMSAFEFTGTWQHYTDASSLWEGHQTANTSGASASISFAGTRARLIALRANNRGIGKVYLDGVFKANVDFYNPSTQYQFSGYDTGTIAPGVHTLRIDWTGTKNANSSNTYIDVDGVVITG
jgi:hypothetical protein